MKLLLDTHIWLWALLAPEQLSEEVRELLVSPENEIWLSPVSVWEAVILAEKGRIDVSGNPADWVEGMVSAMPGREAPLTREIAIESRRISLSHQDQADRFLVATAKSLGLALVTSDGRLVGSSDCATIDNRGCLPHVAQINLPQ